MAKRAYSQWKFTVVLAVGAAVALVLCVQCIRTYLYTESVLVPQQAEHEAARQAGAVMAAARGANIAVPRRLAPALTHAMESSSDRVLWIRVLDTTGRVVAQKGTPEAVAQSVLTWPADGMEPHEPRSATIQTVQGKALLVALPLRLGHPPPLPNELGRSPNSAASSPAQQFGTAAGEHPGWCILEVAVSLKAVSESFAGLRQNLVVGVIASLALLASLALIALRAPHYVRGRHLENELALARRVQDDLHPKPQSLTPHLAFAASSAAADQVGGDFHDIFEAEAGRTAIVLGDVSGKGVPAALLASVLHGAIRSSGGSQHELACERINRMLCERTARERFATLFWGVFDPAQGTLRYVNAGHAAPLLVRAHHNSVERLDAAGGPVLGLLPSASYQAGVVTLNGGDTLVLYSDGVSETTNAQWEEFGDARVAQLATARASASPQELCDRIVREVARFSSSDVLADDRTLLVVQFHPLCSAVSKATQPLRHMVAVA
jgi:hypothetical protein